MRSPVKNREVLGKLTPEVVAKLFELKAGGSSYRELETMMEGKGHGYLRETAIRKILHRHEPFGKRYGLYAKVDSLDEDKVKATFRAYKPRPGRKKPAAPVESDIMQERHNVLMRAMDGYLKYMEALQDAEALGMNDQFVKDWLSLMRRGDLSKD